MPNTKAQIDCGFLAQDPSWLQPSNPPGGRWDRGTGSGAQLKELSSLQPARLKVSELCFCHLSVSTQSFSFPGWLLWKMERDSKGTSQEPEMEVSLFWPSNLKVIFNLFYHIFKKPRGGVLTRTWTAELNSAWGTPVRPPTVSSVLTWLAQRDCEPVFLTAWYHQLGISHIGSMYTSETANAIIWDL